LTNCGSKGRTIRTLFGAHNLAFGVFGGIPGRGIYDNMRTAIDKVGRRKERDVNVRFQAMASHYRFEPDVCNPASGWEKGQVEKNVQDACHRLWQRRSPCPHNGMTMSFLGLQLSKSR
jgi:transposase